MKKEIYIVFLFIIAAVFSACNIFSTATAENSQNNISNQLKVNSITPTPKVVATNDTPGNQTAERSKPEITVFDLILKPIEKKQKNVTEEVYKFYGSAEIAKNSEFDIVNEYGFLAKGKFVKYIEPTQDSDGSWEIEIIKDSLRSDFNKLSKTRMMEMENESPTIPAYGVFPSTSARQTIRSGEKIDQSDKAKSERQSVYRSLPTEITERADVYSQKGELEYPNRWADFDGDGKIDFVYIRVRCDENPNSHCGKYLYFYAGKWSELPENNLN